MLYFLKISTFNIIIIIFLILTILFCIYLLNKIKNLKEEIKLLTESKKIEKKISYNDANIIPIKEITEKPQLNNKDINKQTQNNIKKNNNKNKIEIYKPNYQTKKENNKAYNKNILNERNKTTSPISINTKEFNINEYIQAKNINKNQKEKNYLEEVSKKIKKEIESKPIELTEYEQEEELNAIISYQELLNSNEKNITSNDNSEDFLEQLKKLRNSL